MCLDSLLAYSNHSYYFYTRLSIYAHAHPVTHNDLTSIMLLLKTEVEVDDDVAGTFEPYPVQAVTPLVGPG